MSGNHDTQTINDVMNNEVGDRQLVPDANSARNKLGVDVRTAYIAADAFLGNPYSLLGRVIEVRGRDKETPTDFSNAIIEFSTFPIPGIKIDESSKLKEPIKRESIIVNSELSAKVNFFNYMSAELNAETVFSIMTFDQVAGLVDVQDVSWFDGVSQWMAMEHNKRVLEDPNVHYVYAVIGFVQKYIIRKKFVKFEAGAKGGGYGLNVEGALHNSTDEYSLDIRFGLTPNILKRPLEPAIALAGGRPPPQSLPGDEDLFGTIKKIVFQGQ